MISGINSRNAACSVFLVKIAKKDIIFKYDFDRIANVVHLFSFVMIFCTNCRNAACKYFSLKIAGKYLVF